MPGRVKHRHPQPKQPTIATIQKNLLARMADTEQDTSVFSQLSTSTNAEGPILSKQAIIWITVISVIVIAALIVVCCLLCRCKRRRKKIQRHSNGHRYHPSLEITDGRNEHHAWNRLAKPLRTDTDESGTSLTPLSKAAVRPAGTDHHPGDPVIIEQVEEPLTPVYARNKNSRYHSGFGAAWQRVSQIGRAY